MYQTRTPQVFTVFGDLVFEGDYVSTDQTRRKSAVSTDRAADKRRLDESLLTALARRLAA